MACGTSHISNPVDNPLRTSIALVTRGSRHPSTLRLAAKFSAACFPVLPSVLSLLFPPRVWRSRPGTGSALTAFRRASASASAFACSLRSRASFLACVCCTLNSASGNLSYTCVCRRTLGSALALERMRFFPDPPPEPLTHRSLPPPVSLSSSSAYSQTISRTP